jgi:DnaJ-class molecular chaperone
VAGAGTGEKTGVFKMRDPYEVLGVGKNADATAIKGAYRRLAKKLHPDANKSDPKTAQRFAEINSAYEILGEEKKRRAFDAGEIDAEGKPRFQGFGGPRPGARAGAGPGAHFETFSFGSEGLGARGGAGSGHFEDIIGQMFGGFGGAARGQSRPGRGGFEADDMAEAAGRDITLPVTITLEEAAAGGTKRVRLPTGKEVDVKIPSGLADGKQIRLKGKGAPGPGGMGDLLIALKIAPHQVFERDGPDLRTSVPIALYEAVLGGKVRVPTLGGAVELAIPPNTSGGRTFRLKGKGMTVDGKTGDLFATVTIALPDAADRELDDLMKKWREHKPYDPRRDVK